MQIQKIILKTWKQFIDIQGITVVANGAKVNYRTLKSAIETGECEKKPYDKINTYIIEELKAHNKVKQLLSQKSK